MKSLINLIVLSALATACNAQSAGAKTPENVIESIWNHIGGKSTFDEARYLQFTWVVEKEGVAVRVRSHKWDRFTGDYVVGMRDKETGDSVSVFFNVNTKKGVALRNGIRVPEDEATSIIESSYASFINDTYWLVAPAKLEDPGVKLSIEKTSPGNSDADNRETVLHLAFDGVGLTPGDQYWLHVDDSGRVTRWRFVLEGGQKGDFAWLDETDCGMGLLFSTNKMSADGSFRIFFPDVMFSRSIPEGAFDPAGAR